MSLLEINNLQVGFHLSRGRKLRALNGVSLAVEKGECVGLVGESGCGKSTLAGAVLRLVAPLGGTIFYAGTDVLKLRGRELFEFRGKMQMVFQDPYGSLNPRLSVGSALEECLAVQDICSRNERPGRVGELLRSVGLEGKHATHYPHEFSGGQRQRIGIARALAVNPEFIIADEPVSALDVSIQAQILNLLKDLQEEKKFSFLFIAHDLAVVRYMCTRVYVMYLGEIMEAGATEDVYTRPAHPYTRVLLDAVPDIDRALAGRGSKKSVLEGEMPSLLAHIGGCPFHPRCPLAKPICKDEVPETKKVANGHFSRCHFAGEIQSL
ncbi:MAG: ABC transporter ATP-binding protein [Kiritimatiellia bacterium]|nr:ABC transporter ATP-binding protein [Kiritimatiellia bacterium]